MLNYYGIDMGGTRDEKMNKTEKKKFLDNLNSAYDAYSVQDILSNKTVSCTPSDFKERNSSNSSFFIAIFWYHKSI